MAFLLLPPLRPSNAIPLALILLELTRFKPFILFERGIGLPGDSDVVLRACDTEFECFNLGLVRPLAIIVAAVRFGFDVVTLSGVRCLLWSGDDCVDGGPITMMHFHMYSLIYMCIMYVWYMRVFSAVL